MTSLLLVDELTENMSNYSVYFLLQNNGLNVNCSVYSLMLGTFSYRDYYSNVWLSNVSDFLPAYYATNCSISEMMSQIKNSDVDADDVMKWWADFQANPYNVADNGDSFVALLFTVLGLCVSCWMLLLMFVLLPKYKRKPFLTHLAVLMNLVVFTVVLAQISDVAREEYYADSLDMIYMLATLHSKRYPIAMLVLKVITLMALIQLVYRITKPRWKRHNLAVGLVLLAAFVATSIYGQTDYGQITTAVTSSLNTGVVLLIAVQTVFVCWYAGCLAYYTLAGTASSPRQVSYSRKLIPLAILAWFLIALDVVLSILSITYWRSRWLITSWVLYFPMLIDMSLLTTGWEWFYSIRDLELKLELVGMLGRKITLDDVMSFSNDHNVQKATLGSRFAAMFDTLFGTSRANQVEATKDFSPSVSTDTPTDHTTMVNSPQTTHNVTAFDVGSQNEGHSQDNHAAFDENEVSEYEMHFMDTNSGDDDVLGRPENDNEPVEGTSRAGHEELPPFRPHPGYSRDDYWDDK